MLANEMTDLVSSDRRRRHHLPRVQVGRYLNCAQNTNVVQFEVRTVYRKNDDVVYRHDHFGESFLFNKQVIVFYLVKSLSSFRR